jgi:hypothetical protein
MFKFNLKGIRPRKREASRKPQLLFVIVLLGNVFKSSSVAKECFANHMDEIKPIESILNDLNKTSKTPRCVPQPASTQAPLAMTLEYQDDANPKRKLVVEFANENFLKGDFSLNQAISSCIRKGKGYDVPTAAELFELLRCFDPNYEFSENERLSKVVTTASLRRFHQFFPNAKNESYWTRTAMKQEPDRHYYFWGGVGQITDIGSFDSNAFCIRRVIRPR